MYDHSQARGYKTTLERRLFSTPEAAQGVSARGLSRQPRGGEAEADFSVAGLLWAMVWGAVSSLVLAVVLAALGIATLVRLPQLASLLPQSPRFPAKQLVSPPPPWPPPPPCGPSHPCIQVL
jgi:hypothetical protein